jgi:hypothetical protein
MLPNVAIMLCDFTNHSNRGRLVYLFPSIIAKFVIIGYQFRLYGTNLMDSLGMKGVPVRF